MGAVARRKPITVDEYLNGELASPIKHEYLGGVVYAMAGGSNWHNRIATNILGSLHARLRGKRCEPFNSDTKIRVRLPTQVRFYYPDAAVVCDPNPLEDSFQDHPQVIVEVLSASTRRIDEFEKKDAYLTIPSLSAYVLVEQESASVVVFRRQGDGFAREELCGLEAVLGLPEIEVELPLSEVYERVEFDAEPTELA